MTTVGRAQERRNREVSGRLCLHVGAGGLAIRDCLSEYRRIANVPAHVGGGLIEAELAVMFFMHLWSEKRGFLLFVAVFTIFVLLGCSMGGPTAPAWSSARHFQNDP